MKQYNIFGGVDEVDEPTGSTLLNTFGGYDNFVEKFKDKHTTDDCYTPPAVYDAVLGFCKDMGWVTDTTEVIRPFYPGEDFTKRDYPEGCVVVDKPPFSLYAYIVRWFLKNNVRFFLFGPQLTLKVRGADVCYLATNSTITYENGANVNTGFVTNMMPGTRIWTAPPLVRAIKDAQPKHKNKNKNTYPIHVLSPALLGKYSTREVDFQVTTDQCYEVQNLDSLKRFGKSLFGGGWLLSEKAVENIRLATEAAEERETIQREEEERARGHTVQLSPSELAIIKRLSE